MSSREIDRYLAALDEPKRSTLEALRRSILDVVPEAEQCISYGVPAFKGLVMKLVAARMRQLGLKWNEAYTYGLGCPGVRSG